jgi:hypothetical protein
MRSCCRQEARRCSWLRWLGVDGVQLPSARQQHQETRVRKTHTRVHRCSFLCGSLSGHKRVYWTTPNSVDASIRRFDIILREYLLSHVYFLSVLRFLLASRTLNIPDLTLAPYIDKIPRNFLVLTCTLRFMYT